MQSVSSETLAEVAALAAASGSTESCEAAVSQLLGDPALARRALDWLPEAFGLVLIAHIEPSLELPTTFLARGHGGEWIELALAVDPLFAQCLQLASVVFHNGPRELFERLALASSVHAAVNDALNHGVSLKNGRLHPIRMLGLSAETYDGA